MATTARKMNLDAAERDVIFVADPLVRPIMGINVLETLPARIPYPLVDPFILVHEGVIPGDYSDVDTRHPHRGFDNLWYVVSGSTSTGHSTGPGGAMERARLEAGALLKIRTGRGVWHADALGEDERMEGLEREDMRGVLFWVNLARRDKGVAPSAEILRAKDVPVRHEGDAVIRVLVGEGSPIELGTPGLILDVELPAGGAFTSPITSDFNGFVYVLEGGAAFGANRLRAGRSQIAVLGHGRAVTAVDAKPGTRFLVMAAKPYGEEPVFNGAYVD
jgi:redox-sensitive bicupin YhaK (pirin superfamily)